jgi:polyisoprenoid-binding protein YceI
LDKKSVKVDWTAFKTTAKVGVNGSFKTVEIKGKDKAKSLTALLKGLNISVDKLSVDTGNPARDATLGEFFFKKLSKNISAKIKSVSEKDSTFEMSLNLNGKTQNVKMTYSSEADDQYKATGEINIFDFSGNKALAALNEKCVDLHKGADGVSKTWPNVVLNLSVHVVSHCH